jgi:phage-related minor tail protein
MPKSAEYLAIAFEKIDVAVTKGFDPKKAQQMKDALSGVKDPVVEIQVAMGNLVSQGITNLVDSFFEAKKSFGDMAADFLKNIAKMIAQTLVLNALKKSTIGGWLGLNATGNAFSQGTGLPWGVYNKPTFFEMNTPIQKFAKGGVLGEAGPEAIMPLKRGRDGRLGVEAAGGDTIINVINNAGVEVQTAESTGNDGQKVIDIMIEKKVKDMFGSGQMDKTMKVGYGLNRSAA